MLLRHAIGAVLRRRRLARGRTLRQLAEESRISLPYLSEIERGRKEASSEILGTLCRVLDLTEQQLLVEVGREYDRQLEPVQLEPVGRQLEPVQLEPVGRQLEPVGRRDSLDVRSRAALSAIEELSGRTSGAAEGGILLAA